MSHFVTVVLVPPSVPREHLEDAVARMLAPFDENLPAAAQGPSPHDGKWDWHVIGGRWDGWLYGPERHEAAPNASAGSTIGNNARIVRDIPMEDPFYLPFAVLTPEGHWHEVGRMGAFALVREEMPRDQWHRFVQGLYAAYPDHVAVAVDCHV